MSTSMYEELRKGVEVLKILQQITTQLPRY